MAKEQRDHNYVTPADAERCRSKDHDKQFSDERLVGLCSWCARYFWCSDPDRCPGGLRTTLANAGEESRAGAPQPSEVAAAGTAASPRPSRVRRKKAVA